MNWTIHTKNHFGRFLFLTKFCAFRPNLFCAYIGTFLKRFPLVFCWKILVLGQDSWRDIMLGTHFSGQDIRLRGTKNSSNSEGSFCTLSPSPPGPILSLQTPASFLEGYENRDGGWGSFGLLGPFLGPLRASIGPKGSPTSRPKKLHLIQ